MSTAQTLIKSHSDDDSNHHHRWFFIYLIEGKKITYFDRNHQINNQNGWMNRLIDWLYPH